MSKTGRKRALDATKCREVCAMIAAGAGRKSAAHYVGCSVSTIRREAQRNDKFDEQLRRAEAHAEMRPLETMRDAAARDWRAAAWLLERCDPQRFGRQPKGSSGNALARRLGNELIRMVRVDVADPFFRDQLTAQISATIERTTGQTLDVTPTKSELQASMEYFDRKGAANRPSSAHAGAHADAKQDEFCTTRPQETNGTYRADARSPGAQ